MIVPLDFSEIFNIFRIRVYFLFCEKSRNFSKRLKIVAISKLTQNKIIFKKTIVYGCLQYGVKQKFVTTVVCDLEI